MTIKEILQLHLLLETKLFCFYKVEQKNKEVEFFSKLKVAL